ncbi:MAG: WYL domain-containing protein [Deltaproteobacteria bacterium]|nr:MAG: WYL domain-containing protein [Deltaproteobacteria bacterium]
MTDRDKRSERVVALLLYLLQHGSITKSEAARRFHVTPRTAAQDLRLLGSLVPELHPSGKGRHARWVLDPTTHLHNLGILDRVSLLLGRDLAWFLEGTALHGGLDRAGAEAGSVVRWRWDRNLPRKFRALHEPARRYPHQAEVIDDLLDALIRERMVELRYGFDDADATWKGPTRPLTLTVYRRALYLLASPDDDSPVRRYSVSKIHEVRIGDSFEYPRKWDPDAELAGSFGIHAGGRHGLVVIEFAPEVAHYVHAREWAPGQRLIDQPDGSVHLWMHSGGPELVRWVLEWGDKARVIEPDWLVAEVVAELQGALSQYDREEM